MRDPSPFTANEPNSKLTITEHTIANLWNEVLRGVTHLQPTDNFFALGGDSMAMVTLEFRIKEQMGVELAPGTLLSAPTLRELSSTVDSLMSQLSQSPHHTIGPSYTEK